MAGGHIGPPLRSLSGDVAIAIATIPVLPPYGRTDVSALVGMCHQLKETLQYHASHASDPTGCPSRPSQSAKPPRAIQSHALLDANCMNCTQ
jgi:hypothetical protein